ncbi:MAG: hypothetical protein Hyperionvirus7_8 [Hyperionvirus sp.]|uniref:Uncharacterized protein n=1 Tax=Hyperionvirus sp. TaxID=2487770 RepID=A0A3G5A840_9VIRU|nr:MAG: hypothetical protein Hyperionvirus7_8 [Hyperionvirus sp.]
MATVCSDCYCSEEKTYGVTIIYSNAGTARCSGCFALAENALQCEQCFEYQCRKCSDYFDPDEFESEFPEEDS